MALTKAQLLKYDLLFTRLDRKSRDHGPLRPLRRHRLAIDNAGGHWKASQDLSGSFKFRPGYCATQYRNSVSR